MVQFDDITVVWGSAPDQLDLAMARWRQAVFQDVAISDDDRFMYFLYDPEADEQSGTSGARKGPPSIVVFDTNAKKFVREMHVPLRENNEGVLKFLWQLEGSRSGRAMFIVVTEQRAYGNQPGSRLAFWQLFLASDGLSLHGTPVPLFGPLPVGQDFIVCARHEEKELVVLTGPGLTVWRIDGRQPSVNAVDSFGVAGGDMARYYDAFTFKDKIYMLASSQDGLFDFGYVSVLSLGGRAPVQTQPLQRDSVRGYPPSRRQAGLDLFAGRVYMCGGEVEQPDGSYFRLQDVWSFDVVSFTWHQYPCQIPLPLIEPRLTAGHFGGALYVWGDCDVPRGCVAPPTHSHIVRMTGVATDAPPSYQSVADAAQAPAYPMGGQGGGDYYTQQQAPQPYPGAGGYGGGGPQQAGFNPQYPPAGGGANPQYPPQQQQQQPPAAYSSAQAGYPPSGPGPQSTAYPPAGAPQYPPAAGPPYAAQVGAQQQAPYPQQQAGYPPQQQQQPYGAQPAATGPPHNQGQPQGKDKDCCVM